MSYDHQKIETKWQKRWEKGKIFVVKENPRKKKFYVLDMFPYPSAEGLHVGHPEGYTGTDIISRKRRMEGWNVLHPMGFDAFGLPTENYAIKHGIHPRVATEKNIKRIREQIKSLGFSYDWSREVNTTDPNYYKWTQWIFLKLFKRGLAYQAVVPINWCPSCKTGLANEEVVDGKCERCKTKVTKKDMRQWMLKITAYADRLLKDLEDLDWPEQIKEMQRNWIGRSEGAEVDFRVVIASEAKQSHKKGIAASPSAPRNDIIKVFTTRPDTLFGATYMVVAPEHEIISKIKNQISNIKEVEKYIEEAKEKSDLERQELKDKTGVELKGIKAVNPVNNEEIPIWVADYVLPHYGTGAIMAVPAHDERDFEFAKKFGLPVVQTVAINLEDYNRTIKILELLRKIREAAERADVKVWVLGGLACAFYAKVIYRLHEDLDLIAKTEKDFYKLAEIFERLGFKKIREKKLDDELTNFIFQADDGIEIDIGLNKYKFGSEDSDFESEEKTLGDYKALVLSKRFVKSFKEMQVKERGKEKDKLDMEFLNGRVIVEDGYAVNSQKFNGLTTEQFKKQIIAWLEKNNLGKKAVNYKLRDWVFSRQRYWGEPIPLVYCEKCAQDKPKFLFLHGFKGSSRGDFWPWLKNELESLGFEVFAPDLPNPGKPNLEEQIKFLLENFVIDDKTIIVTHSLGGDLAMKMLAGDHLRVRKLVMVVPPLKTEFKDKRRPELEEFCDWKFDFSKIKKVVEEIVVMADKEDDVLFAEHPQEIAARLDAKLVEVIAPSPHFNCPEAPVILDNLLTGDVLNSGWVPVPEKDLPVKLPEVKEYKPTGTGESPLVAISKWVNIECPTCGGPAKRETNTMPQWAGSCWYYLRYLDSKNKKEIFNTKKEKYWMPVDLYVGGAEHAVLHLLYARFWHKVLYDEGLVSTKEPFSKLRNQGIILGEDGQKMSKSRGNVINPDDVINQYGADTMRLYEMFMGPFEDVKPWSTKGIIGVKRFLERVWQMSDKVKSQTLPTGRQESKVKIESQNSKVLKLLHQTIKKVTEDIENFKFNTAISQMMILTNEMISQSFTAAQFETFLKLLSPFAPHIVEELWEHLGYKKSIILEKWPTYDPAFIMEEEIELVVQVNGKVRDAIKVKVDISEEEAKKVAMESEKVKKWIEGKEIKKIIFVKGKLINVVV